MTDLDEVRRKFREFYFHDGAPAGFEQWVYQNEELEKLLGQDLYLDLVSADFGTSRARETIARIVCQCYERKLGGDLIRDRTRDILNGMLGGSFPLSEGCRELWRYSLDGKDYIPSVFAGYATELEKSEHESFYRDRVLRDVEDLLKRL